ncbi:serine protease [Babesia caballi]|uniref:Serine protease n=1 Tax=Babesia caballi TaxID=5871 RepID=A0AAV4LSL6_BABCB|nr:serine protease [Babesia caballi]
MSQLRTAACDPSDKKFADVLEYLWSTFKEEFPPHRGIHVVPVDIESYNEAVDKDPGDGVLKIKSHVSELLLVYTDASFHKVHADWDVYKLEGKSAAFNKVFFDIILRQDYEFEENGFGIHKIHAISVRYPEGAFSPSEARRFSAEVQQARFKEYYDPVKLALATGQFQYFTPSERLQRLYKPHELTPILYHNVFGGWFELKKLIFVMLPIPRKSWSFKTLWTDVRPIPQQIKDALILSRSIGSQFNDLWRDYPDSPAVQQRYDLKSYMCIKSEYMYEESDHPFVRATTIADSFCPFLLDAAEQIRIHSNCLRDPYLYAQSRQALRLRASAAAAERGDAWKHEDRNGNISDGHDEVDNASLRGNRLAQGDEKRPSPTAGATDEVDASPEGMLSPADASLSSKKLTTIRDEEEAADGDLDEVTENPDCTTRSTAQ